MPIKRWSTIPKRHLGPIVFLVYFPECSAGLLKTRKLVEMGRQGRPPHSPLGNGVLALAQRLLGEVVVKKLSRHRKWIRGGACEESSRVSASDPAGVVSVNPVDCSLEVRIYRGWAHRGAFWARSFPRGDGMLLGDFVSEPVALGCSI